MEQTIGYCKFRFVTQSGSFQPMSRGIERIESSEHRSYKAVDANYHFIAEFCLSPPDVMLDSSYLVCNSFYILQIRTILLRTRTVRDRIYLCQGLRIRITSSLCSYSCFTWLVIGQLVVVVVVKFSWKSVQWCLRIVAKQTDRQTEK